MISTISIIAFSGPRVLTKQKILRQVDLPEQGKLRAFIQYLTELNKEGLMVYEAFLDDGENIYCAFSDYAAFLYKRRGQIVLHCKGDIQINKVIYRLASPYRIRVYSKELIDCKIVRRQTQLIFNAKR